MFPSSKWPSFRSGLQGSPHVEVHMFPPFPRQHGEVTAFLNPDGQVAVVVRNLASKELSGWVVEIIHHQKSVFGSCPCVFVDVFLKKTDGYIGQLRVIVVVTGCSHAARSQYRIVPASRAEVFCLWGCFRVGCCLLCCLGFGGCRSSCCGLLGVAAAGRAGCLCGAGVAERVLFQVFDAKMYAPSAVSHQFYPHRKGGGRADH